MKIPSGMLEEYKQYVREYINQVKEKGSGTLQFNWFISDDRTEVEILEVYASSEAALKHLEHLRELQGIVFKKFGAPYSITIYGDPSPELLRNVKGSKMNVRVFSFLHVLQH